LLFLWRPPSLLGLPLPQRTMSPSPESPPIGTGTGYSRPVLPFRPHPQVPAGAFLMLSYWVGNFKAMRGYPGMSRTRHQALARRWREVPPAALQVLRVWEGLRGQFFLSAGPFWVSPAPTPKSPSSPQPRRGWSELGANSKTGSTLLGQRPWGAGSRPGTAGSPDSPPLPVLTARGAGWAPEGSGVRTCVPASRPQVVSPLPCSSGKLGRRCCPRQTDQPPKSLSG
jgi:hypothetical protein